MARDEELDELYGAPLDEFTARRNALAKALKQRGEDERAAEVKSLTRPTLAAWAVNQLAHKRPIPIRKLVRLTEKVSSSKARDAVRQAMEERRQLIASLADDAAAILEGAERKASASTMNDVVMTLSAATSPEELESLAQGRFTRPIESSGFVAGMVLTPEPRAPKKDSRIEKKLEEIEDELKQRAQELKDAERAVERARRELQEAKQDLAAAERKVKRLQDERADLKDKLD